VQSIFLEAAMAFLRVLGILMAVLGVAIQALLLLIVIAVPRAELPKVDTVSVVGVAIGLIGLGVKIWRVASTDDSKPMKSRLTEFQRDVAGGVSRASMYGTGCLILGLGLLIPVGSSFPKSETRDDLIGSLMCAGVGPLPLILCGLYLMCRRPKQPDSTLPGPS
jgi:hypothetical protein